MIPWPRRFRPHLAAAALLLLALIPLARTLPAVVANLETRIRQRSAMDMRDDFRGGLSAWRGAPGWDSDWAFDPAGTVRPGKLALWKPSSELSDYRLEITGQIQKTSLSWAFRAADVRNYYAMKITITQPGPLPRADIVRYAVVNGVVVDRIQSALPMAIRSDTFFHIRTSAYGNRFVTWVNDKLVDAFSDPRHPAGGVGLFSSPGESFHVMSVRVADQDDLLGRVCAFFSRPADKNRDGLIGVSQAATLRQSEPQKHAPKTARKNR